jgi:sulfur-oxidizing protein SoxX
LAIGLVSAAVLLAGKASSAQELVAYNIVDEISIPKPLTDQPGDPVKGREVAINRKKGNCLACHVMPIPEQSFHGEIGPDLTGVGSRYKIGELRLRVVDPKTLNPDTMMPAFYRNDGFHRVAKKFEGKTILGPQEVEDLLAYLMSLRDG